MDIKEIDLNKIFTDDKFNCRGEITPASVANLARDIDNKGLIQPVVITPLTEDFINNRKDAGVIIPQGCEYLLIAGYRRTYAHKVLKKTAITAVIKADISFKDAMIVNLSENLQRTDLTFSQEAEALQKLKDAGVGEVEAATRLGKSRGWIQQRYLLLKLPIEIRAEVDAGMIKQTDIRALYSIFKTTRDVYGENRARNDVFKEVRKLKDAKLNNKKIVIDPNAKSRTKKRLRSKTEILELQNELRSHFRRGGHKTGNTILTRLLAWAAGEITTDDLYEDISEFAFDIGVDYEIPEKEIEPVDMMKV